MIWIRFPFLRPLIRARRPGFMARLSHLIFVQVLFVFVALLLIFFTPASNDFDHASMSQTETDVNHLRTELQSVLSNEGSFTSDYHISSENKSRVVRKLQAEKALNSAFLFTTDSVQNPKSLITYGTFDSPGEIGLQDKVSSFISLTGSLHNDSLLTLPIAINESQTAFVTRVWVDGQPLVLVTVWEHDLYMTSRTAMKYALLLLFLGSLLTVLLIIHLISTRFVGPFKRLIHGLRKTAEGELYYMVETSTDRELEQLSESFNRMSRQLWDKQQRLKESNAQLEEINRTLAESQSELATVIDSSPVGIIVTDIDGTIRVFNKLAVELFQYPLENIVGSSIDVLFTSTVRERAAELEKTTQQGFEVVGVKSDESMFPAYLVATALEASDGSTKGWLYTVRDISESKNYQKMMISLDRYYTRGEMAGDISHDINNYLSVLQGNLELLPLLLRKGKEDKVYEKIDVMQSTVGKITKFSAGLMDSDHDECNFELADLNQVIENVLNFIIPQKRFANITFQTDLATEVPLVEFDLAQMQQVLVNLINNAADATFHNEGERIISIGSMYHDQQSPPTVEVSVHDNGPGVPEDRQSDLFNKRFTTKRKGHGIGLVSCRRILDLHNGDIFYTAGVGATFAFRLPCRQKIVDSTSTDVQETVKANA